MRSDPGARQGGSLTRRRRLRLAAEILATYAWVRWLLARHELPRVIATLRRAARGRPVAVADPERCRRHAHAVVQVLRPLPTDSRCLVRSLVLVAVLARRGAAADLVIGVMPAPGFAAHAWVEHDGIPLLKPGGAAAGRLVEL